MHAAKISIITLSGHICKEIYEGTVRLVTAVLLGGCAIVALLLGLYKFVAHVLLYVVWALTCYICLSDYLCG